MGYRISVLIAAAIILAAGLVLFLLKEEEVPGDRHQSIPMSGDADATSSSAPHPAAGVRSSEPKTRSTPAIETRRFSSSEVEGDPRFSQALRNHFLSEFLAAWPEVRQSPPSEEQVGRGWERFKEQVLELPATLARDGATSANEADASREALESRDGPALVKAAAAGHWKPEPDTFDATLLESLVAPRYDSGLLGPEDLKRRNALRGGMTLEFGPGVHTLDYRRLRVSETGQFPRDLTIRGAGMNVTQLRLGDISANGAIERLRIHDLTLDCGNDYLFDLRRGPLVLDLERVRIVRFDMGAGSSLVFGVNQGLLLRARNCEILGGYGRHPGSGNLWRGDVMLARLTNCRIAHLRPNLSSVRGNGLVVFDSCRFERLDRDPRTPGSPRARFVDCIFEPLIPFTEYHDSAPRSLTDFNPAFRDD